MFVGQYVSVIRQQAANEDNCDIDGYIYVSRTDTKHEWAECERGRGHVHGARRMLDGWRNETSVSRIRGWVMAHLRCGQRLGRDALSQGTGTARTSPAVRYSNILEQRLTHHRSLHALCRFWYVLVLRTAYYAFEANSLSPFVALAAATFFCSPAGFGFLLFAPAMYKALGYGKGDTILAYFAIAVDIPA